MPLRYFGLLLLLTRFVPVVAQVPPPIPIETEHVSLVLAVGDKQRVYQTYLGPKLAAADHQQLPNRHEAYVPAGTDNLFEPAIRVVHPDGNPSLALAFADVQTSTAGEGVTTTTVHLRDPKYPVDVLLHFTAYYHEDVIKTWTEITHREKKSVVLTSYASAMLHFDARQYWLTQFHGDWAEEAKQVESQLTSGIRIIDTKLGTRDQASTLGTSC